MDRVLVVDDETGIRGLVSQWVESLGCVAVEALSAEDAVRALTGTACDVAVCDVRLPGHDGLWLARYIHHHHHDTAVVLSTGIQDIESAVGGLRAGIVDYLLKPYGYDRFREAMDRAREWHRIAAEATRWRRTIEMELDTRRRRLTDAVAALSPTSDTTVHGMVALLTVRNRPAFEHAVRVAALARDLALDAGLSLDDAADLERAALLHEVPRTVVPETILWKPGELTDDEWSVLRREPEIGHAVFTGIPFLAPAAEIIRAMRERFDGSGYPHGLAGLQIPIAARILALADAYETMIRPQSHREPLSGADAALEVRAGRGSQFDPGAADILLARVGFADAAPRD
jgi:putative two-component system response regulator